jgi:thiol-disulfide isomerase/thioredoxin
MSKMESCSGRCGIARWVGSGRWREVSLFGVRETHLPGFEGATGWLNSEPLTPDDLRGKVVLVDFWTYTCINWLRTLGYVRAWYEKYGDQGLVVVGVHTPEFPFEQDVDNVREAAKDMRVEYPIALDSDYAVWRAFDNNYWPAVYIADAQGRIRHHQYGEGGYEECERVIQGLLREAGRDGIDDDLVSVAPDGLEAQADWDNLGSPETYLGYQQAERFASPNGAELGEPFNFVAPDPLGLNRWALSGDWTIESRAAVANGADGRILFRFHARDVHLVMGPRAPGTSVPFRVLVDGEPPAAAHGLDVDEQGRGTVAQQRLYQLIREQGSITDRTFEITFLAPGVEAYAFTFG